MPIHIEAARVRDADEILKLQYLCYQAEAALYDDWGLAPLRQTLCELLAEYDTHSILVAREAGEVVGAVRAYSASATWHIGRLIVHPRFHGQGFGKQLLLTIEQEGQGVGVNQFEVFTGHRSERNLSLYQRAGYREFKRENVSRGLQLVYLQKESLVAL